MYAERGGTDAPSAKLTREASTDSTEQLPQPSTELCTVPKEEPKAPAWTTRNSAPGPRGCWALNKQGLACGSPVRADGDYCNAHSGIGVGSDPAKYSRMGQQASIDSRRRRADLRLVIGSSRLDTPRAALRAAVLVSAERLGGRAVAAALDPNLAPKDAVSSVIALVDAVDPRTTMVTSVQGSIDPSTASLSQLLSFAEAHGIEPIGSQNGSDGTP